MTPQPDKAQQAASELRELIRQAHEAAQDLRAAAREARALVDQYAHDQVETALNEYTKMMAEHVSDVESHIVDDMLEVKAKSSRALQSIGDAHTEIFAGLMELSTLSTQPPRDDFFERRKALIECGKRLKAAYERAGIQWRTVDEAPEHIRDALERARASER